MLRRIVVLAILLPGALVAQSAADVAVEARTRAPSCEIQNVDRITLIGTNDRARADSVAAAVSYWLRARGTPGDRSASFAIRVSSERAVEVNGDAVGGDSTFQRAARQAVLGAVGDHAFDALAPASGAPAAYTVLVGGRPDGGVAKPAPRRVCFAVARPDNPRMAFPPELSPSFGKQELSGSQHGKAMTRGSVRATFRVDSAGTVVPGTIAVMHSSDEAFTRELERSLPNVRFYPATIDGRPLAQRVEQEFEFELNY